MSDHHSTTKRTPLRRLHVLASHLAPSTPLPNARPGDDQATPVPTSYFLSNAWTPRTDEKTIQFSLTDALLVGGDDDAAAAAAAAAAASALAPLKGSFLRIGPNPRFDFQDKPYHVFDGDGMIHQLEFHGDGNLTYRNKFIRTDAFQHDEQRNFSFSIMGEASDVQKTNNVAWMKHARSPMGRANTALCSHNNKLYALFEQDVPYSINPNTLDTIEKVTDYGADLPFTAHPKVCSINGDMVYFGYINGRRNSPYCHYGVADKSGVTVRSFPITLPHQVMMHDVAITSTRSIFFDYNNRFQSPKDLMSGKAKGGMYQVALDVPARFGILPRMALSDAEIVWIEVPSNVVFHFVNAWDVEGKKDEIIVWGCGAETVDLDNLGGDNSRTSGGVMQCWHLNVKTKMLVDHFVMATPKKNMSDDTAVDFPQIRNDLIGRECRFSYCALFCAGFTVNALTKYDLVERTTKTYYMEDGVYGGEAVFVPNPNGGSGDEDDGWLMCFVYGDDIPSALEVVDARTMRLVARIQMPARVPAGFHAMWL